MLLIFLSKREDFISFFYTYYQFIDDATMTAKVKAKLFDDPVVRGTAISVETFKGTVQLSGFANSKEEANKAESLAKSVEGVRAVRNSIVLKQ